jgi:ubiquinone/menaquinone biosynthesis C-methylase UbiE
MNQAQGMSIGNKQIKKKSPHKGTAGFLARREAARALEAKPKISSLSKPQDDKTPTSWGKVATWYHDTVEEKGSYQKDLILPNLLRLMDIKAGETILDLACGEGFFSRRFAKLGAKVIASDIAPELIAIAKKNGNDKTMDKGDIRQHLIEFQVAPADNLNFIKDGTMDKAVIVLAIQNIENVKGTFEEVKRVLKPGGRLFIVVNHPAFRVPKESSWGWDPEQIPPGSAVLPLGKGEAIQYRRIDRYLSESRVKIDMAPGISSFAGAQDDRFTVTFHRPLQFYFKQIGKAGFGVTNMEEWSSNRLSQPGPRAEAENRARKEIPLFMCIEAEKI